MKIEIYIYYQPDTKSNENELPDTTKQAYRLSIGKYNIA